MTTPSQILTSQSVEKTCKECGNNFQLEFVSLSKWVDVCPGCSERHAVETQQLAVSRIHNVRAEAWKKICPPDFLDTFPNRLPSPSKLATVLAWQYQARGLLLHGETGTGKTRCAYVLLKREFMGGRSARVLDAGFAFDYAELFSRSCSDAAEWLRRCKETDLLLLDDVFKAKLTDSLEQALFTIINNRTEQRRPIIVTTNDIGATLLERMSPDRGQALVRRLREACQSISFGKKEGPILKPPLKEFSSRQHND